MAGGQDPSMLAPLDEDRVLDWHDELRRIERRLAELPDEARIAVQQVVERFRAEDGAGENGAA